MTRILKQPADARGTLRLPVRHTPARTFEQAPSAPAVGPRPMASAPAAAPAPADAAAIKAELDALREAACREGLAQGRAQGEREARAAHDAQLQRWRDSIDAIDAALRRKLDELEPLGVAIAFEAVAALLGEAYLDRDALVATVRRLLDAAAGALRLTVQVAPDQLPRVRAAWPEQADEVRKLKFEADPALGATECRVVSERGQLESGLALQLQAIQDALLQAFAQRHAGVPAA